MPRRTTSRYTHGHAAFILIPLFSSLGASVSLSEFNTKIPNLPSQCQSIYTQQIAGCSASDFAGQNPCSQSCINALQSLSPVVKSACANARLPGNDVISAFESGDGVQKLCPNVNSRSTSTTNTAVNPGFVSTVSFTSTLSPSIPASSTTSDSTTMTSSTSTSSTSSTLITSASTAPTMTASMTSLTMDTSSAPPTNPSQSSLLESMLSSMTSAAPSVRTSDSSDRSGGGSPFDISAARPSARAHGAAAVVLGAMLIGATLTF